MDENPIIEARAVKDLQAARAENPQAGARRATRQKVAYPIRVTAPGQETS
jgi:hypothetical protein